MQERDRKDDPPVLGLYNLKDDPRESRNLIEREQSVANELQGLCEAWVRRVTPPAGQKPK